MGIENLENKKKDSLVQCPPTSLPNKKQWYKTFTSKRRKPVPTLQSPVLILPTIPTLKKEKPEVTFVLAFR